jgi:hypothetical protein
MDEKELEEGMTWKDLLQSLREKVRAKVEKDAITWVDLLLLLESERSFYSMRKEPGRKISVEKEKSSPKVLDYFLEKAWERPVLKSCPPSGKVSF